MNCSHFGTCGGCSLFGLSYAQELERKRSRLADLLRMDVPPFIPSPRESGFRQKATFVFGSPSQRRGLVMGHYAARSKTVVPIDECPVHSARANKIAFSLCDRLMRANILAADRPGGILRHLLVRTTEDDAEAIALLVVARNDKALRSPIRAFLDSPDAPDGFFVNVNTRPGPFMVGGDVLKIAGRSQVRERAIPPIDFLVSPDAFFQTNVAAARELVRLVLEGVGSASRVLDLYCGSGLFALSLARGGATVTAVEDNRQAIADLTANAKLNRIGASSVQPIAARVEDALERLRRTAWDAIVLDPPREGCAPEVLAGVFRDMQAPRVVYVSCNPAALSEELPTIVKAGYTIQRVQPIDMFPHTEHIETVVTLGR